jgi:hypothetical protein
MNKLISMRGDQPDCWFTRRHYFNGPNYVASNSRIVNDDLEEAVVAYFKALLWKMRDTKLCVFPSRVCILTPAYKLVFTNTGAIRKVNVF